MNSGKTLFAQLMDLPWSTFTRIVARYRGDQRVRTLSCAEHYRAMAFAQLTYRESLRDIDICLSVQTSKLYSMGFRDPVRRSTLADANEARDWRIYAELAQRFIVSGAPSATVGDLTARDAPAGATKIASCSAKGPASSRTGAPACKLRPSCRIPRASAAAISASTTPCGTGCG